MRASDGDNRITGALGKVLRAGPHWASNRALLGGAAAAVTVLAVTGIVALSASGSDSPRTKDAAATTKTKPHYLLPIASLIQDGTVPPPTLSGDTGTVGVPSGTAPRPTTAPTTAPDPNASDITTFRGSTGTMTPAGIATLALERGCNSTQAVTATAIAMAESGGSPSAQGDVTLMTAEWDWSAGLWQIRGLRSERGTGALRDSIANQRAATNSAAMFVISSGCTNWTPWTTYTRGLYLGYVGVARQAVNYVVAYYKSHGHYPAVAAPDPTAVIPVSTGGGGGVAAAPAGSQNSSAATTPRPTTSKAKAAPKAPAGGQRTTGAAQPGGGSGGTSAASKPQSGSTPTAKVSTPKLPALPTILPSNIVPTKVVPTKILPTNLLPTCILGLQPPLCHN